MSPKFNFAEALKGGLMEAGNPGSYLAERKQKLDEEKQQQDAQAQKAFDAQKAWKNYEAETHFSIWEKRKNSVPLAQWEKDFAGIKDQTDKPTELELWKQANSEALSSLGGSSMMGLSQDRQSKYYPAVYNRYLDLKKQFGMETDADKFIRVKTYLKSKGKLATDDTAKMYLQYNPNF